MRTRIATKRETLANGTVVERRRIVDAGELEWRIQAAAVLALKRMPEFDREFTIAGDMNAARRGPQAQVQARATGLAPGDPDLRLYLSGGRLRLIEYKGKDGRLSPAQKDRHALLKRLGFDVVVVKATTKEEGAAATVRLVESWLGKPANDNGKMAKVES